ncbi:MAG: hypothetical protein GC159_19810 [Phycisphaera sp.]|nr:hypothetical protein [Phycisphaera sp.]
MRWWVFAILAYLLLALQVGLADAMAWESPYGPVAPRFLLLLAVLVGLWASESVVFTAWGVLGLLTDLASPYAGGLHLVGPYALGYLAGAYFILQVRPMLFRRHPLTIASMMMVSGGAIHLVVIVVFFTRKILGYPLPDWSAGDEVMLRLLILLYSAAVGGVLSVVLVRMVPLFGFEVSKVAGPSRPRRRGEPA